MEKAVTPTVVIGLLVRTALAAVGGSLVDNPDNLETLTGAGVLLIVAAWSWIQKKTQAKKLIRAVPVE